MCGRSNEPWLNRYESVCVLVSKTTQDSTRKGTISSTCMLNICTKKINFEKKNIFPIKIFISKELKIYNSQI